VGRRKKAKDIPITDETIRLWNSLDKLSDRDFEEALKKLSRDELIGIAKIDLVMELRFKKRIESQNAEIKALDLRVKDLDYELILRRAKNLPEC
jgi:hypothetical protein